MTAQTAPASAGDRVHRSGPLSWSTPRLIRLDLPDTENTTLGSGLDDFTFANS
jgi:hypothetical protein